MCGLLTPRLHLSSSWGTPRLRAIGRTQACFSGRDSVAMGPCFSSGSTHCSAEKRLQKSKGFLRSLGSFWWGGNKGPGFEIRVLGPQCRQQGSLGQTVARRGSPRPRSHHIRPQPEPASCRHRASRSQELGWSQPRTEPGRGRAGPGPAGPEGDSLLWAELLCGCIQSRGGPPRLVVLSTKSSAPACSSAGGAFLCWADLAHSQASP